jgi:D-alanyl-D-alanine carboxypeptidase
MKKNNRVYLSVFLLLVSILVTLPASLPAGETPTKALSQKITAFLENIYPKNEPGAAVLAVKDGKIILRQGFGMANLELGIPINPGMVFRIGSITKQFTSVAIMKLAEAGKLSVSDDIEKYLPDYPTHGHTITIQHLLNHTSGIKSYTNVPAFFPMIRKDMTPTELIDTFKNQPMDFAPGERFLYNNSGYVLLGAIIEKVSGQGYESYIVENIFKPLGMNNSYYDSPTRIIPQRVSGYEKGEKDIENTGYLSMTLPYAAGSLASTVDDLHRWYQALEAGKAISQKSLEQMVQPTILKDGKTQNYGYGWSLGSLFGEKTIEHGGGINGFTTYAVRVPEKKVLVVVLTNCTWRETAPEYVAKWIAALLCGKPVVEKKAVTLDTKILDAIVGTYQIGEGDQRVITREGNRLFSQRSGSRKLEAFAESETEFFFKGNFSHFTIVKDDSGKVIKMIMHSAGADEEAIKIPDQPTSDEKK